MQARFVPRRRGRKPENLAFTQLEGDISAFPCLCQSFDFQNDTLLVDLRRTNSLFPDIPADHHSHQLSTFKLRGFSSSHQLPVSHDADPIRNPVDFLELVRHIDQRHPTLFEVLEKLKKIIRFLGREATCRLVQEDHRRARRQSPRNLDELLVRRTRLTNHRRGWKG